MPCDGVTVLPPVALKSGTWEELSRDLERTKAALERFFEKRRISARVAAGRALIEVLVAQGRIVIDQRGVACASGTPDSVAAELQKLLDDLAGYMRQDRVRQAVAKVAAVEGSRMAGRNLVINVRL